jgi:hypothetical protein
VTLWQFALLGRRPRLDSVTRLTNDRVDLPFGAASCDFHHVDEKIRQQLQELRELGILSFVNPGSYETAS